MGALSGFGQGLKAPWRGFRYMLEHPGLIKYAVPPAILNGGLLVAALVGAWFGADDVLGIAWSEPLGEAWYTTWLLMPLWWCLWFLTGAALSVLSVVLVYLISIPLAGPFNELLAEKVEEIETGFAAPFDWRVMARNVFTSAAHVGIVFAFQAFVFLITALIGLIPVVGQVIAAIIGAICTPLLVGFAPFDYPMTIRLWSFGDKLRFVFGNFPRFFGFSLASFALLYVPFVNLVFLPSCVVGATLTLLELEKGGRLDRLRDRRKESLQKHGKISQPVDIGVEEVVEEESRHEEAVTQPS